MRSHMLVHLDSLNAEGLNNTLSLNVPLGLYLSKSHDKNNMFLNRIKARKDIVLILNDSDSTNVITSQQSIVYLFRKNLDSLHITKKSIENNDLMFDKITDFGLLTIESGLMVSDSMFVNLWNISGKLPNFVYEIKYESLIKDSHEEIKKLKQSERPLIHLGHGVKLSNAKNLAKKLEVNELSMGMSGDYLEAVKSNATYIRVGSKIFGSRV